MSATQSRRSAIVLAGAGRFAEEVGDVAYDAGFDVAAWIEGIDRDRSDARHVPPILWIDAHLAFEPMLPVTPAAGPVRRKDFVERIVSDGRPLMSIVHPTAVIARSAEIEPGCVIMPNVVVGARTRIARGTIVNRGALIGHHTTIGAWSFVGPGANVAGGVRTGEQVYVGLGSIVRDDRLIGARAVIGAGAVVVADVEGDLTVVGLPARPMERV